MKGFKDTGIVEAIKDSEFIYERVENPITRLGHKTFFRKLHKYYFMFEEKKDGQQS